MIPTPDLRTRAEALGQTLPPLLAEAEMLASTVMMGEHGRRRAGLGDEFWQYRPAHQGDSARMIDWRRSARSDSTFVRDLDTRPGNQAFLKGLTAIAHSIGITVIAEGVVNEQELAALMAAGFDAATGPHIRS